MTRRDAMQRLAEPFEQLRRLAGVQREAALHQLELDPADQQLLRELLAADDDATDPLAAAISAGAQASQRVATPTQMGPWRLTGSLGSGGMGSVHLAERADGAYAQQVALKLLHGFPDHDSLRRFRQERQILAGLEHPNIARLLDGGETVEGQHWLAMEHVDGERLLDHVARTTPSRDARLALFDAMLAAVEHAHQRLIVHRDLKPANVMVRHDGVVKLLDFGIARLVDDKTDDAATSTRIYSPGYASPEQRDGRAITTASDIYSLGILLGELLGQRREHRADGKPDLAPVAVDTQLAGIIAKASDMEPQRRYTSVGALRDELHRFRSGRPVLAAPITPAYRLRKFIARHRLASLASLLAAVALIAGISRLSSERSRALAAESRATAALATSERDNANARAALDFLVGTFEAAAPERALSRQVSVRDLLDQSRRQLEPQLAAHPALIRPLQRLLGNLYMKLGDAGIAAELLEAGLDGEQVDSPAGASRLANDYDGYSDALLQLERRDLSSAALAKARALRERWLPGVAIEQARSIAAEASLRHHGGDNPHAIALWREALGVLQDSVDDPASNDVLLDIWQSLAGVLNNEGNSTEALEASRSAHAIADRTLPDNSPERVLILRGEANALLGLGRPAEAEAVLRTAIALQERSVGLDGTRMGALYNDLGTTLNALDRYSEAITALERSRTLGVKLDGVEGTATLVNMASVHENAGDYPRALILLDQALEQIGSSGIDTDSGRRRQVQRIHTRLLMVMGQLDEARRRGTGLREQARLLDGEDSFEYASLTWLLTQVERRGGNPAAGLPLLADARIRFAALVPENHPFFAQAHRAHAAFAIQQGNVPLADDELTKAIAGFTAVDATLDLAIARTELADLRWRQQRHDDARRLLHQSLPALRKALLPEEIHRAAAERLAAKAGLAKA